MPINHLYKYDWTNPDLSLSPLERDLSGMSPISTYGDHTPNRHGVIVLEYETTPNGMKTGWRLFKCQCGTDYYGRKTLSQTRGCGKCGGGGHQGGSTKLELIGKKYGAIEVVGHERGRGWKIKCDCGRERSIMNSTLLASGGYKTCGQCTEEERRAGASTSSIAPPSSLRDAVVAANRSSKDGRECYGARGPEPYPYNEIAKDAMICSLEHPPVYYRLPDHPDGCPLCMAMARIELLEAEADSMRTAL